MKFRYTRLLAVSLVIAIFILFSVLFVSGIDPMTHARSQNGEIIQYLTEARKVISDAKSHTQSVALPSFMKGVDEYLSAAQVVANDQKKTLDQIAEKKLVLISLLVQLY